MQRAISTCLMRGGSSKGVFLRASDLPPAGELRDSVILRLFGSPDPRQIDGLGGADVLTSKLAIVGPPSVAGADVDYTFGQVSFIHAMVDYKGNCGNISAAVGPFAIDEGLVQLAPSFGAKEWTQLVRIHNTNTGAILRATIPVGVQGACVHGATTIAGVPGTGARIDLDFSDTQGSVTGRLLPTGHLLETVEVAGQGEETEHMQVTLLDAGQPTVFVAASSLGLPAEIPAAEIAGTLEQSPSLMRRVERLRGACAVLMGIVDYWEDAERVSPYPFRGHSLTSL
jgi:2-methylaconitate cis-trans-isomerase PrpF